MPIKFGYTPYDIERTYKAIAYLQSHYTQNISADQLAEEITIDKRKLQQVMQVLTGHTVHNYLIKVRLDRAIQDLEEKPQLTIEQIADKHGFPSSSKFIRHFRLRLGMTPKEYRYSQVTICKVL